VRRLVGRLRGHRGRLSRIDEPSFTFVLPALNAAGPLFERALASIRAQDYPQERVEILVADGGSTDSTRADAERHGARVIENPNRLAEWGVKEGMLQASGDIVVVFAADNELVGSRWLADVGGLFTEDDRLAAVYGRLVSGEDDPALNKYVALIQSEPLNWFLNRNLEAYLAHAPTDGRGFATFEVEPTRPLVWGANGLAVRREWALPIWSRAGYVADVDAFHRMVATGHARVAYTSRPYVFHHQVATLGDYRRKWRRNAVQHLVEQAGDRDLDWVMVPGFRRRALMWGVYSVVPVFSTADAVRRAVRDRSAYWLFHPAVTFLQALTYAEALATSPAGRGLLRRALLRRG
jgi:glycosyltransferase involved in cell wall biosynthesis